MMKYRPEIDGLRAIAVLPVVLFHGGLTLFSGGFVGVDIFFVISGFLISAIIIREINSKTFSFLNFYERRIRRILPALIAVILASLIAALLFALPEQLEDISQSSIYALLGVSNIHFWLKSGYFSPAAEYTMFLHTWSLGVEEQFYLFLPPILIVLHKRKWRISLAIATALPLAFIVSLWLSFNKPSVAFYLMPARAWELGLGAALAVGLFPKVENAQARSMIALCGLCAIIFSIFYIDSGMAFPGWAALIPCLGTVAIIHSASQENWAGRFLSWQPLRFIGLISYSFYLWHWPVFVAYRMYTAQQHIALTGSIFCIVISFILAALTWKYVETPFRSRTKMPMKKLTLWLGSLSATSIVIALVAMHNAGLPSRLDQQTLKLLSASNDIDKQSRKCHRNTDLLNATCQFGVPEAPIDFFVIGDSHAAAIRPAIEEWALKNNRAGTLFWSTDCPILIDVEKVPDVKAKHCTKFKEDTFKTLSNSGGSISTIFLAGRWGAYYTGIYGEIGGSFRYYLIDDQNSNRDTETTQKVFEKGFTKTLKRIESLGAEAIILGPVPEIGFDVPTTLALASHNKNNAIPDSYPSDYNVLSQKLDTLFDRVISSSKDSSYISLYPEFCSPKCKLSIEGVPIYSDADHISYQGAKSFLGPIIIEKVNN